MAGAAVARFGRIDTRVNNAGMGIWGRLDETEEADARRPFEISFSGLVNGSPHRSIPSLCHRRAQARPVAPAVVAACRHSTRTIQGKFSWA